MDEDIQPSDAKENSGNGTSPLIDRDELVLAPDPNHNMRNGRKKSEVVFDVRLFICYLFCCLFYVL